MDPKKLHDQDALREAGVHLTPYGLPEYPRAAETAKLLRQIAKGIPMPSGETILPDDDMAETLAGGWLYPDQMVAQFRSPRFKSTRAGMAATVSGLMAMTALQTNPFNPRPKTKLEIPEADAKGRVAMPWAPTDRRADPDDDARMVIQVTDRDELNGRVLESERHILAEQSSLADLIAREGIEEDVLAIVVRYETVGITKNLALTTVDGNSRLAIARSEYREWISRNREEILSVVRTKKPRLALAKTIDRMRDGLFPLEQDDKVALRHLHKAMAETLSGRSTGELIDDGLYAVPNLFVVPVTMIVAFEPADDEATVLDAADQMMRNVHHPSRAPKVWDQAAGHSEVRDEVVAKLADTGWLSIGEALFLGPRYEEATRLHGAPSEPDRRAYAAIDLVNGDHDLGREARALIAEAIGSPSAGRLLRAQIITAILSEQVHTLSAKLRKSFETTMHDVLDNRRYGSVTKTPEDSGNDPEDLLAEALGDQESGCKIEESPAMLELGLKGAAALAAQGHLMRLYGTKTEDSPRPYQVIDNMLEDTGGLGLRMLAGAIEAWREGTPLPEYDVEKRKPIKGAAPMRPSTLAVLFPNPDTSIEPADSSTDLLHKMQKTLANKFQPVLDELLELPEVRREGAPPDAIQEVLDILVPARQKLELQMAKFEEFHASSDDEEADLAATQNGE
jgi:hypothetical protein